MDSKIFNEYMLIFKVNYGLDFQADEAHAAYCRMIKSRLKDYPDQAVKDAFEQVLNNCFNLPKWADFAKALGLTGDAKSRAKAEWAIVLGMLNQFGGLENKFYRTSAATEKAIKDLGGWSYLGHRSYYDLNKMGPAFESAYNRATAEGLENKPGQVTGIRQKDWQTGEYKPLTEVQPGAPLEALPEPVYLEESTPDRREPIAVEYSGDTGRLARKVSF